MSKIIKVKMTEEESSTIENLFFRHNFLKDMLKTFMSDSIIPSDRLKSIEEETFSVFTELEKNKGRVGNKYMPEGNVIDYTFNFDTCEVEYTSI